jgi:pectinesterase
MMNSAININLLDTTRAHYRPLCIVVAVFAVLLFTFTACAQNTSTTKPAAAVAPAAPKTNILVAKDGSGDYKYIQDAIDAVRAFTPKRITIYIRNGIYKEKVHIPAWVTDINLVGESTENTIITYDDHAGRGKLGTFETYTFRIEGNNINVENLTIRNTAGPVGQAVALHVEGERLVFRNCRFLGDQDTIFASGEGSQQYYVDCYIEGTTDFIFGPATALFENCQIHSKKNSYITAASTPEWVIWGYVFKSCTFTAAADVKEVYLGRPWRDYAKTVFINCILGPHIRPEGWHNWSRPEAEQTVFYAEYNNTGPGAGTDKRVPWSHQLTEQQAAKFTADNIFSGHPDSAKEDTKWYRRQIP